MWPSGWMSTWTRGRGAMAGGRPSSSSGCTRSTCSHSLRRVRVDHEDTPSSFPGPCSAQPVPTGTTSAGATKDAH
jgi:hypothetical protein